MNTPKELLGKLDASAVGTRVLLRLAQEILLGFRALGDLTGTVSDAMDQCGIAGAVPGSTLKPTDRTDGRRRGGAQRLRAARDRSAQSRRARRHPGDPGGRGLFEPRGNFRD